MTSGHRQKTGSASGTRSRLIVGGVVAALLATIGAFAALVAVSFNLLHGDRSDGSSVSPLEPVQIVGPEETVYSWPRDHCVFRDYPDLPARAFRDAQGRTQLIASHYVTRRMVGPHPGRLTHQCAVIMRSDRNGNPATFNDLEWIASPYTLDGRTVYALVHNEYQGHRHKGRCPSGDYESCWYNAITLAVSFDGGRTFRDARRPPQHLVAASPYPYVPDRGPSGVLIPSNIVRKTEDGFFYALMKVEQYDRQQRGSCLLRTANLADPSSWRAWDGSRFTIRLGSPYPTSGEAGGDTCQPVSPGEISVMSESLTYNTYLGKYLLVGLSGDRIAGRRGVARGIFYSVSDDLIHWSHRKLIREVELFWTYECGDPNPILYPSLIDHGSPTRNFTTTGRRPYLYFTRFHYRDCVPGPNRDLVRVRLAFTK